MAEFLAGMIWGAALMMAIVLLSLRGYEIRKKMPYRWACSHKGCSFAVSASEDFDMVLYLSEQHQRVHIDG